MAYKKRTWQQKLHPGFPDKVETTVKDFADIPAGATMFIATPEIVDQYIRNIPEGTFTTLQQMRRDLAATHNAQYCCPVTSGIFLRIVAEAAYEAFCSGTPLKNITPFWRMIAPTSPTAKKLSFGTALLLDRQKEEGIMIPGKISNRAKKN